MITEFIQKHCLPSYRLDQFNYAYYQELIGSFDEITTWPKDLRSKLSIAIPFSTIKPIKTLTSTDTQTTKFLFERANHTLLETVLMEYNDERNSICVSCMVGCPVGCTFCATGQMGFKAMLTSREIVDQILHIARLLKTKGEKVSNIIFMGMGEPLLNLDHVLGAIAILTDPNKFGLSPRRITISTSGYAAQIDELVKRGFKGRLALSLHAPNQELRLKLMPPAASAYDIHTVLSSVDRFAKKTKKRISYEYILIDQLNDRPTHAHELGKLLKDRTSYTHINLIPYNPVPHQTYKRSTKASIFAFSHILEKYGLSHTIRVTMGDDIKAACGQLATT